MTPKETRKEILHARIKKSMKDKLVIMCEQMGISQADWIEMHIDADWDDDAKESA